MERDADGLPLFGADPAVDREAIDPAAALRLEQDALALQDLEASHSGRMGLS